MDKQIKKKKMKKYRENPVKFGFKTERLENCTHETNCRKIWGNLHFYECVERVNQHKRTPVLVWTTVVPGTCSDYGCYQTQISDPTERRKTNNEH